MALNSQNTSNAPIEPWMTELSAWADVFDISIDTLSQDKGELLAEEKLNKEKRWLDSIPITTLYASETDNYGLTEFAFFIISDSWKEPSLISLKNKTGASLLFGLQTTNHCISSFEVIDSVIRCKPDEVQQVIKVFEVLSNRRGNLIDIDFNDVKTALKPTQPAQFIQATTMGTDRLDRTRQAIAKALKQIPENTNINTLILSVKSNDDLSLEDFSIIDTAVDNRVTEDTNIWYGTGSIDEPNCCQIEVVYWIE